MTKTDFFPVSSSEALLLGFCVGEFLTKKEKFSGKPLRFIDILFERLKPHVPDFGSWNVKIISNAELPADLVWSDDGVGQSIAMPTHLYERCADAFREYSHKKSLNSLLDLVISALAESLEMKVHERYMYGGKQLPYSNDDATAIKDYFAELMQHNEQTRYAEVGETLGRMIAEIDLFEDYAHEVTDPQGFAESGTWVETSEPIEPPPDLKPGSLALTLYQKGYRYVPPDPKDWIIHPRKAEIKKLAWKLIENRFVRRCNYAVSALKAIDDLKFLVDDHEKPDPTYYALVEAIQQSRNARMSLWLALGHLLGVVNEDDAELTKADIESVIPRGYKDLSSRNLSAVTPSAIVNQINLVESSLLSASDFDSADTLARLIAVPEAITRKLWPTKFDSGLSQSLQQIYSDIIRNSTSDIERRFASIARTLHGSYRNSIAHQFGEQVFSPIEVRFYLAAMRVLVYLWNQIESDRKSAEKK
jgi:hypothetical protein